MVIDTSAIVAILFDEPERREFDRLIARRRTAPDISRHTGQDAFVIEGRSRDIGRERLDRFLAVAGIELAADSPRSRRSSPVCEPFRRYGKGRHPVGLNIGDCFPYALAKSTGEPLLFKGNDFSQTDIVPAYRPA